MNEENTIFYKMHQAGLFNKLMSLEIALGLSKITNKKLIIYNARQDTETPIDTPSLTEGLDLGKRANITKGRIPSIFELIDYPKTLVHEIINIPNVETFLENEIVIDTNGLVDNFIVVSDQGNIEEFGVNRKEIKLIPKKSYHFKTNNLASYSRFFCGRSKELDEVFKSIKFKNEYLEFSYKVAKYLGDFNGIHLRLGDHRKNYNVLEEDLDEAIELLSNKKTIVLTDDVYNSMIFGKNIIMMDDIIVDNFSKEFSLLPNTSEVAYGLVCALVMTYSNDFIGTFGSTFSNYIYRERLNQKDINFKYLGMPQEPHGFPFSWNTKTLEGWGSIAREWPESKLNL
jgi:hypothetical protein